MRGAAAGDQGRPLVDPSLAPARLWPLIAFVTGVLAAACGGVLLLRRLSGALIATPPPAVVLAAVAGLAILTWVAREAAGRASRKHPFGSFARTPEWLARSGLLMAVLAVAMPPRLSGVLDAAAAAASWAIALAVMFRPAAARLVAAGRGGHEAWKWFTALRPDPPAGGGGPLRHRSVADVSPAGNVVQRFERFLLPDGSECVRGRVSVVVAAGTRSGSGHLGFCPPLVACPTVDASTDYDGIEAVVAAAEVLPWGIRVECRLDEPAEETIEIPVDLLAMVPA